MGCRFPATRRERATIPLENMILVRYEYREKTCRYVTTKGKKDEKDIRTSCVVPDTRGWAQSQTDGDLRYGHGFIRKSRMRRTSRTGQSLYSALSTTDSALSSPTSVAGLESQCWVRGSQ